MAANLGLPNYLSTIPTFVESFSNNILTNAWPATPMPSLFNQQVLTYPGDNRTTTGAARANGWNYLCFDQQTSRFDDVWLTNFKYLTRDASFNVAQQPATNIVVSHLTIPATGIYQIECQLGLSIPTFGPLNAASAYPNAHVTLMVTKNSDSYVKYQGDPKKGAYSAQPCTGVVDGYGDPAVQKCFVPANGSGLPGFPGMGPNNDTTLAYDVTDMQGTNERSNFSQHSFSCNAPYKTLKIYTQAGLQRGDTIGVPIHLMVDCINGSAGTGTAPAPTCSITVEYASFAIRKVGDTTTVPGNLYGRGPQTVTSLYIDPFPLALAPV